MTGSVGNMGSGNNGIPGSTASGAGLFGGPSLSQDIGALQAGSSALSGLGALYAGQDQAYADQAQAAAFRVQAATEAPEAQGQVAGLKQQYLAAVGGQSARMAAGGVDVGQGVGAANRQIMGQQVSASEQSAILAGDIRAHHDQANALMADASAAAQQQSGQMGLIGGLLSGGLKLLMTG